MIKNSLHFFIILIIFYNYNKFNESINCHSGSQWKNPILIKIYEDQFYFSITDKRKISHVIKHTLL